MIWTTIVLFGCLLNGALSQPALGSSACEGGSMELVCSAGASLIIEDAFWGRVSETDCPHESITDYACAGDDAALNNIRRVCEGRAGCEVAASWRALGDPCPGTYKHGNISYQCKACENSLSDEECEAVKTSGGCESDRETAFDQCFKTCSRCEELTDETCDNPYGDDADCDYWALWGECEYNPNWMLRNCKQSCKVCQGEDTRSASGCEGGVIHLQCDAPYHLSVQAAKYGRYDESFCPHESAENTTDCMSETAPLTSVKMICDGRQDCDVSIINDPLMGGAGDPCTGVYKQMEVDYKCQLCENMLSQAECEAYSFEDCDQPEVFDNCFKYCSRCDKKDCGNDYQSDEDCDYWAMDAECPANPDFMHYQCAESCDTCSCNNIASDENCNYWADEGECEANPGWMPYNCMKSCGECGNGCTNDYGSDEQCNNWAWQGECQANPFWMLYKCKYACSACGDETGPFTQGGCEAGAQRLHCDNAGQRVRITEIFYGRRNNDTCAHASYLEGMERCGTQAHIYENVTEVCNGREDCMLYPSNGLFGDVCPGVTKQLEVTYMCQECKNIAGGEECVARAEAGECDSDPEQMLDDCFQECTGCAVTTECRNNYGCDATTSSDDCGDDLNCDWWAMHGECDRNPDWMMQYCAKSCKEDCES